MALSNTQIKNAKPKDKQYKLADRDSLYLLVRPIGSKVWKYDFRLAGRRGTYTIGTYPEIGLAEARQELITARRLVKSGINPTHHKKSASAKATMISKKFSEYCDEWINKQSYADSTKKDLRLRVEKNIYPYLDKKAVDQFNTRDIYNIIKKMSDRGTRETALRMTGIVRRIYAELFTLGIVDSNPAQGVAELLPKNTTKNKSNFAHITDLDDFIALLKQIHAPAPKQNDAVSLALKLMPLLFLRPKNIRMMTWQQVDFKAALLTIPGSEMKTGKELKVPLATQAISILKEAEKIRHESSDYVFTTKHGNGKPMSENTTTFAIKRLINPNTGKKFGTGFMTSHGFRHTASTMLNELGYDPDVIELQLAHENRDRIRATYNKAQLMDKRTQMMQEWADHLYTLLNS